MTTLDDIKSNNIYYCLHCGKQITLANYSGWEAFTNDGITTQPICRFCEFVLDCSIQKAENVV